jgi:hypothetical protein
VLLTVTAITSQERRWRVEGASQPALTPWVSLSVCLSPITCTWVFKSVICHTLDVLWISQVIPCPEEPSISLPWLGVELSGSIAWRAYGPGFDPQHHNK